MFALISFCNQGPKLSNLVLVNLETRELHYLPLVIPNVGILGLCQNEDYIFIASNNYSTNSISVLRKKDFSLVTHITFPQMDIHSICIDKNSIYANDTAHDAVVVFTWDPLNKKIVQTDTSYSVREADAPVQDSLHVNSIVKESSSIYVTMFGSGKHNNYAADQTGQIMDIVKRKAVTSGLNHPHSLRKHNGSYYYCESVSRKVFKDNNLICQFNEGYLRGLDLNDKYLLAGISKGRKVSKSTGKHRVFKDQALNTDVCAVMICDPKKGTIINRIDFWPEHTEIFDCMILRDCDESLFSENLFTEMLKNQVIYYQKHSEQLLATKESFEREVNALRSALWEKDRSIDKLREDLKKTKRKLAELKQTMKSIEKSGWFKLYKAFNRKGAMPRSK